MVVVTGTGNILINTSVLSLVSVHLFIERGTKIVLEGNRGHSSSQMKHCYVLLISLSELSSCIAINRMFKSYVRVGIHYLVIKVLQKSGSNSQQSKLLNQNQAVVKNSE